ncbi:MAG: phosphate acyltransferase PlsX [Cyanobacteria bacterium]|nr:phosphate acyltransferase PlsX [Cyanobacteriota bacterium]
MRIAIDAMGGDHAPREVVHGAVIAAREYGIAVQLVGSEEAINNELKRNVIKQELQGKDPKSMNISIVPASEVVNMDEKPSRAILKKKDASIVIAIKQVADGKADAVVAAGSTGAAAVAAQFGLGRIANVARSAIACSMPTIHPERCILLDVGANVDCDANMLLQFGLMGSICARGLFNIENPRVGLLNIGTEETKGTELVQEAYKLFKTVDHGLNFIGFVEGRDYPLGKVDVVVTDGFTGNVSLKSAEGIAKMIAVVLRQEFLSSVRGKVAGVLAKPCMEALKAHVDHDIAGGAILVGVKGVCVIAHGGSRHTAIKNAMRVAKDMVMADIVNKIETTFSLVGARSS